MKPFKIFSTLANRDGVLSTLWSTLQQLVVAASTFFIVRAIAAVTEWHLDLATRYIVAFVASLILVYVPGTLSLLYLQRWRLTSFERYVNWFAEDNFGKTSFGHEKNKAKLESWLTNESLTVYGNATSQLYDLYSTLLNSSLNVVVIALALDMRLLGWYGGAGLILLASGLVFGKKIEEVSNRAQDSRKNLGGALLSAWDNVFVGNRVNLENWRQAFVRRVTEAKQSATHYDLVRSLVSSLTVVLALIVVATGNAIFLSENRGNLPLIAGLLITMPRQLQIIQSIFAFFNMLLAWKGDYAQLLQLQKAAQPGADAIDPSSFVQMNAVQVVQGAHAESYADVRSFIEALANRKQGRWTLRGRNGAGKSTLLSLFKESAGENAFYLPTQFSGLAFGEDFLELSSGNRLLKVFREIAQLDVRYVVLDEWDANLDKENMDLVCRAIDEISLSRVVIESRHRSSEPPRA